MSYAGCYQMTLGRWWPWGFGEDTKFVTLPNRFELSQESGTWGFEENELLIRANPPASAQKRDVNVRPRASFWELEGRNRVSLFWTDGLTGVTLRVTKHNKELTGWAHPHFDFRPLIPRIARVKAKRIPCNDLTG